MKYLFIISPLLLSACTSINTGNDAFDAIYSGTAAIIKGSDASSKCQQGHLQDRINCRQKKDQQVKALNKSLKKSNRS